MGVVYLAEDTRLGRQVALMALPSGRALDPTARARLHREARAAARLVHPGIATVYALEEVDGELFIASEYVPGHTLRAELDAGPLDGNRLIDTALQVARALAAAHAAGVVHRDLKPENVMRTAEGSVKVLDFGLARIEVPEVDSLTREGALLGTPAYMSPEQIRGDTVDARSDLFVFGGLVYELGSGRHPFRTGRAESTLAAILEHEAPPLPEESLTPGLNAIVLGCLRKRPEDRYQTSNELVTSLEQAARAAIGLHQARRDPMAPSNLQNTISSPLPGHRRWWELHQAIVTLVYVVMLYPVWTMRAWLPSPVGVMLFFALLAVVVAAVSLRWHLWFSSRVYPSELRAQRERLSRWILALDLGFTFLVGIGGMAVSGDHHQIAALCVTVAIASFISCRVIEPATARAAFGDR
jgi:serine/threonine protein kinase